MIKFSPKTIVALLIFSLTIASCAQNECTEIAIVNARVSFFSALNPNTAITIDSLSVVGLNDEGQPLDTLLYKRAKNQNHILLPVRGNQNTTTYQLTYHLEGNNETKDTLTLHHQNRPYVLSPECGCVVFHTLSEIKATHHTIKESRIINNQITNKDEIHITLLY